MALSYLAQDAGSVFITGLSTDTKPPSPVTGWTFLETDTGKFFIVSGGVWTGVFNDAYALSGEGGGASAWGAITGTLSNQTDLQNALDGKAPSLGADDNYVTDAEKTKLSNLSGVNTGDQDLSALAPKASPAFTGTPTGITATHVGLGNVTNTSDADKPVSTAQQTALDLKANLTSPVLVTPALGTPSSGNLANCTFPTLNQNTSGTAANLSGTPTLPSGTTLVAPVIGAATGTSLAVTGPVTSSGGALGYATGAGGAVTQSTNRTTGVTINKLSGAITTNNASLAAAAEATFTVTNSQVLVGDVILLSCRSGQTAGTSIPFVTRVASGAFDITLSNHHATTADTGAMIINFIVLKSVSS